jgi:hypothetical protein
MDFFGQLVGELDMAPFTTGMGRTGNPAADEVALVGPLPRHLAGDEDLRCRRSRVEGIDKGHDVEPRKLRILKLHLVGEGTALVRLREQTPFVHLNDHNGYGLRFAAGRDPKQAVALATGDNSLKSKNIREAGRNIRALT